MYVAQAIGKMLRPHHSLKISGYYLPIKYSTHAYHSMQFNTTPYILVHILINLYCIGFSLCYSFANIRRIEQPARCMIAFLDSHSILQGFLSR